MSDFLRALFDAAVAAADPMLCVPAHLPPRPDGPVFVIGAGKASARMAEALEAAWGPCDGFVITRDGYGRPCEGIKIVEASHPVPDARGAAHTATLLSKIGALPQGTLVVGLVSGGGSSLMIAPAGDITLAEKMAVNEALLASGAPIDRMNLVRKHLSRIKGGQLAAAVHPNPLLSLMISDIPGDDPAFIASGPTVGDGSTPADALAVLQAFDITVSDSVRAVLDGPTGVVAPSDARLSTTTNLIIAAPSQSLEAAGLVAQGAGLDVQILGDALEGEARALAQDHAALALRVQAEMAPGAAPVVLLSGGECTVTRSGSGCGGPNAEYALALALALDVAAGIEAIACDTDGVDGAAEVAGAVIAPDVLAAAHQAGLNAAESLANNDAHSFFAALGRQVITGPTLTNVNDFRAIRIEPPAA